MTTATTPTHHLGLLNFAHDMVVKAATFPDDKATAQAPGQPNHCLWTLGHLAETYEWCSGLLDGKPRTLPEANSKLFGMGSQPTGDAASYPPIATVRAQFNKAYQRMVAATTSLTPSQLNDSLKEATQGFADTKLDMIYKIAWHDGWHLGQLTTLRKYLGLPGLFS